MKVNCPRCGKKAEYTIRCRKCGREFCESDVTEHAFLGGGKCPYCGNEVHSGDRTYSR